MPSTIEGYPVIIADGTFPYDSIVTKVTLDDGVTVQMDGFESCPALTTIVFKDNVIIEDDGVCGCYSINRIEIGNNVSLVDYSLCVQPNFVDFYVTYGPGVYTGSGSSWTFVD